MSRTRQHPLPSLSAILGITDKGPDLSSLLPSCFRTEIYSSQPPISRTTGSGDSSQPCHRALAAGALQLLPWPVPQRAAQEQEAPQSEAVLEKLPHHINPATAPPPRQQPSLTSHQEHDSAAITPQLTGFHYVCAWRDHSGCSETMEGIAWPQTHCNAMGCTASPYRRAKEELFLYHLH